MTYEQYMYGDPWMVRFYKEAYLMKRKVDNENMWIQGSYFANAVAVGIQNTFGKKHVDYLKKPMELFPKTKAEKADEAREARKKLIDYLNRMKKSFGKKQKMGVDE